MKSYILFLGLLFGSLTNLHAQCTASFTWSQTQPNVIDFVNTSTTQNPNFTYSIWSFGDATSFFYSTTNPSHTYNIPGTYLVTVTVIDSLTSCTDSFSDSITVTGTIICTLNASITIVSNETCNSCADGVLSVGAVGGTSPYSYLWSNLNSSSINSGLTAGTYSACVIDVNGCIVCDTATIITLPPNACQPSYSVTPQPGNIYDFTNTSVASSGTVYTWSFGDGNISYLTNPSHSYVYSGNYEVCLTIWDSAYSCSAYVCDTLYNVVGNGPAPCSASFYPYNDPIIPNLIWMVNTSTISPGTVYAWDWGDNSPIDSMPIPVHTYSQSGLYTICLYLIEYSTGCRDTFCLPVNVVRMSQQSALTTYTVNVTFQQPNSVLQSDVEAVNWSLYPVPASDFLSVNSDFSVAGKTYRILDLAGRTAQTGIMTAAQLDVSELESGVYLFLLVDANSQISIRRFVKE